MERPSQSRNSPIRRALSFIPERSAEVIHRNFPDLTPNQVTFSSGVATVAVAVGAAMRNVSGVTDFKGSKPLLAGLALAQALDFFDGSLAREIKRLRDRTHDSRWGGMWDAVNDRWGAGVMGISRIVSAHTRGDRFGEIAATLTTLTNPLPSLLRAVGESKGEVFPESGENILEFFGTHTGRTILAIPATLYPTFYKLQSLTDTISAAANMLTIYKRAHGGEPTEVNKEGLDLMYDANFRGKALFLATIGTAGAVLATHFILHESTTTKVVVSSHTSLREDRLRRENIHPRLKSGYSVLYDRKK